jgi:TBC1 domain family protein 5
MSSSQLKKNNITELSLIFKEKILLNPYRVEDLKKLAIDAKLSKEKLRPIAWKIFLGVLPNTTSLKEWVEIISNQREEYKKKLKKYCKIKKFVGDPLGGGKKKKKNEGPVEDTDLKDLINKDLDRTHQEMELFLQNKIKNILANVLYIWSKENSIVSYRQGMNELLAIIFIAFYPFYFACTRKPKTTKEDIIEYLKDMNLYKDDIYIFFHDEDEIQSDLFYTFEALMKKGMTNLFDPHFLQKDDPGYKMYEIFPQMWKDDSNENKPTYVYRRSSLIIKEKLKSLDNELYSHFKKIDLNCEVFLQRYLRCIFCREFNLNDVYIIWDIIFYDNYVNRSKEKYDFIYMEYICIAMIFKIRDRLKDADQNECFSMLFKYPEIKDIMDIIKLAKKVEQAIDERLNGKNSNIYDIFGIMKPIESEPSHLFSPHMYNQTNKTNSNSNNNISNNKININNSNNIENNNKIN